MELANSFVVPTDRDTAWATLLDVEAIAPAMPGATLTGRQGDEFSGTVKVRLGPISMVYGGTATFVEKDAEQHRVVIDASGKETRGSSTARAHVVGQLTAEAPDRTRVDVTTDLAVTGRPAQFGRGVMQDVAGRIIDQFAANLAARMTSAPPAAPPAVPSAAPPEDDPAERSAAEADHDAQPVGDTAAPVPPAPPAAPAAPIPPVDSGPAARLSFDPRPPDDDAIDLLGTAGAPVARRLAPVAGVIALALVLWWLLGRRARRR